MIAKIPQTNNIKESSLTFSAPGGRDKEKILLKPAEKIGLLSEGGSAGGFKGGMPSRPSRGEAPPPCSSEQSRAEKRTFPFRRKKSARAKLGKLQSAFFCEAVPLGGTAAGRSVSFAQKRFGFRQTNAQSKVPRSGNFVNLNKKRIIEI